MIEQELTMLRSRILEALIYYTWPIAWNQRISRSIQLTPAFHRYPHHASIEYLHDAGGPQIFG